MVLPVLHLALFGTVSNPLAFPTSLELLVFREVDLQLLAFLACFEVPEKSSVTVVIATPSLFYLPDVLFCKSQPTFFRTGCAEVPWCAVLVSIQCVFEPGFARADMVGDGNSDYQI